MGKTENISKKEKADLDTEVTDFAGDPLSEQLPDKSMRRVTIRGALLRVLQLTKTPNPVVSYRIGKKIADTAFTNIKDLSAKERKHLMAMTEACTFYTPAVQGLLIDYVT